MSKIKSISDLKTEESLVPKPKERQFLMKGKIARTKVAEKLETMLELLETNLKLAMAAGQHEVVQKGVQWYLEHYPKEDKDDSPIDANVDKKVEVAQTGPTGPVINLGFRIGGVNDNLPALPEVKVIDVESNETN